MAKVKGRPKTVQTTLPGVKITKQKTRPQEPKTITKQNHQSIKRNSQNPIAKPTIAPATHMRIKNCIVKIARLHPKKSVDQIVSESSKLVPAATVPNSKVQATSKLIDETRPVRNSAIRRCVVKLKRIKQPDAGKLPAAAIKSTKTTKLRGRPQRMTTITEENSNTPAMEYKESSCTAKMNSPSTKLQTQTEERSFTQEEQPQIPILNSPKRNKLKNLSLTRRNKKNLNKTQNDMHDFTSFDPLRNSTVINFDLNTIVENDYTKLPTEHTNKIHDDSNKIIENKQSDVPPSDKKENAITEEFNMSQKSNASFKSENLANQISRIEELLALDIDDDDIIIDNNNRLEDQSHDVETEKSLSTTMQVKAQVHKFFHTKDAVELDCNANAKIPYQSNFKNQAQSKKSHLGESPEKKKSVYEFSPSQSSDTDTNTNKDPAADIIQKMIEEAKVTVMTRRKGAGRPIVKRIVNKYTKPKTATNQRVRNAANKKGKKVLQPNIVDDSVNELAPVTRNRKASAPQDQTLNGSFSRLARSVMLNESGKYDGHHRVMLNKRQLLDVALKFVSTPLKNPKVPTPAINQTLLSPIPTGEMPAHELKATASPWRVPDTTSIPQAFHFSRNSSNLPSFSSEFIPPTPKKNVKWATNLVDSMPSSHDQSHAVATTSATAAQLTSSYSSNDSNGENVPPPITDEVDNENVYLDSNDLQPITTSLNPRRTLAKRSPLRAINILEVVTLPPWKPMNENREDVNKVKQPAKSSTEDAFGFDELLSSNEHSSDEEHIEKSLAKSKRSDLHKRLKQLKKWRPPDRELPQSKNTRMPKVFDDDAGKLRMHNIKDMFCSTMIKAQQAVKPIDSDDSNSDEENAPANNETQADLFNDTDPQISFNDKKPHRTYGRPVRKKRKQPNNFVLFVDSDESDGGGDNGGDNEGKRGEHQKKKNPKQTDKNNMELKSFVENFNEMCEEVDNYELIVE